jgi:hypothetical protein
MFLAPSLCTSLAQLLRSILISFDDVDVAGATAQVAGNRVSDFVIGRIGVLTKEGVSSHKHSWSTVTTLQSMLLKEAFLERMQFAVLFETFDSGYVSAIGLHRESCTRLNGTPIHHDSTRTTVACVTTDVCSGKSERFAYEVNEQQSRFNFGGMLSAIDVYFNGNRRHF